MAQQRLPATLRRMGGYAVRLWVRCLLPTLHAGCFYDQWHRQSPQPPGTLICPWQFQLRGCRLFALSNIMAAVLPLVTTDEPHDYLRPVWVGMRDGSGLFARVACSSLARNHESVLTSPRHPDRNEAVRAGGQPPRGGKDGQIDQ